MAKPFYKNTWFFTVTGFATVALIASSIHTLNQEGDELYSNKITEIIPITKNEIKSKFTRLEPKIKEKTSEELKKEPIENKITLNNTKKHSISNKTKSSKNTSTDIIEKEISKIKNESINEIPKTFSFMDLHPRISGKLDGSITKDELINEQGLVTNSDVEIISFQLHVVNGLTSQVFSSKSNKLDSSMKSAINKVNVGEEVYFEKIEGKATTGEIFRLSPLRYILLN